MGSLMIFLIVGLSGVLAFTFWGLTELVRKYRMKKRRMVVRFHTFENGKIKVTERPVDSGEFFNCSPKQIKKAKEYLDEAIKNGDFKLGTTLEQQTDLAKELTEERDQNA